jgi:hypothetical protein
MQFSVFFTYIIIEVISVQSCDLAASVTAIACALAKCCCEEELVLLTTIFGQLSGTLATISANNAILEAKNKKNDTNNNSTTTENITELLISSPIK